MLRRLLAVALLAVLLPATAPALAQDEPAPVDIVTISGPLDALATSFIAGEIERSAEEGAQAVILQLNSSGALTAEVSDVIELVQDPPLPLAVWIGPAPARAYGGALQIFLVAEVRMAAPGAVVGYATPLVAGERKGIEVVAGLDASYADLADEVREISEPQPGLVEILPPSVRQAVAELDGITFVVDGQPVTLTTLEAVEVDGERVTTPVPVRFREPGVLIRTVRVSLRPEATFFFLAAGLTLVAFEFYAIGPGVAAAVAALSLLLAGYGLAVLPLRWWGVVLVVAGIWLFTVDYQRGRLRALSWLGAVVLAIGGFTSTAGAPQIEPTWWGVLLTVAGVWLFYQFAMPTVARARFSTPTIGRDHLIGKFGRATGTFDPDGVVDLDGARWRATAHREAGITAGDEVRVTGIDGPFLEVEKPG